VRRRCCTYGSHASRPASTLTRAARPQGPRHAARGRPAASHHVWRGGSREQAGVCQAAEEQARQQPLAGTLRPYPAYAASADPQVQCRDG
jgi:hypothetical protein